jgi:DNA-binding LytR/AlgR family response regulator
MKLKEISYLQSDKGCVTKRTRTYFSAYHQSYLVNKLYIDRYHKKDSIIYLKDATEIPV